MPIAATLGINGDAHLQALLSLDFNGNAITYGNNIIKEMEKYGLDKTARPVSAQSLKNILMPNTKKKAQTINLLTLGWFTLFQLTTMSYDIGWRQVELNPMKILLLNPFHLQRCQVT